MKQGDLRRQLDRALHMLDRRAELAVLVSDDAEQMLGLGRIRLGFEDAAASRLRLLSRPAIRQRSANPNASATGVTVVLPRAATSAMPASIT